MVVGFDIVFSTGTARGRWFVFEIMIKLRMSLCLQRHRRGGGCVTGVPRATGVAAPQGRPPAQRLAGAGPAALPVQRRPGGLPAPSGAGRVCGLRLEGAPG